MNQASYSSGPGVCPSSIEVANAISSYGHESCLRDAILTDMTPLALRLNGFPSLLGTIYATAASRLVFLIQLRDPVRRWQSGYYQTTKQQQNSGNIGTSFAKHFKMVHAMLTSQSSNGSESLQLNRKYLLDEFYRSLYSLTLEPWLKNSPFAPRQFVLAPLRFVLGSHEGEVRTFELLSRKLGVDFKSTQLLGNKTSHANKRNHPSLEDDMNNDRDAAAKLAQLQQLFIQPDFADLGRLLAFGLADGLSLAGYEGTASADQICEYLNRTW